MQIKRSMDETECDECAADRTREGNILPADVSIKLDNGYSPASFDLCIFHARSVIEHIQEVFAEAEIKE